MIKYRLMCSQDHEFEAWFASIASFDEQAASGKICCPECGGREVAKSVMAPHVAARARDVAAIRSEPQTAAALVRIVREARRALTAATEDVGASFPEEARKIHYGEAQERGIRGSASGEEARALVEEGIEIMALPPLPDDAN